MKKGVAGGEVEVASIGRGPREQGRTKSRNLPLLVVSRGKGCKEYTQRGGLGSHCKPRPVTSLKFHGKSCCALRIYSKEGQVLQKKKRAWGGQIVDSISGEKKSQLKKKRCAALLNLLDAKNKQQFASPHLKKSFFCCRATGGSYGVCSSK